MDIPNSLMEVEASEANPTPYFDFVNPKAPVDTDVKDGEKYQEYVDRMVEEYPCVWQKNMISYYALVAPVVMLSAKGLREPQSVTKLETFDIETLEGNQEKMLASKTCKDRYESERIWGSCNLKLTPEYRNKLIYQGNTCLYGYSQLGREIVEQSPYVKITKALHKILGLKENHGILKREDKDLSSQERKKNKNLSTQLKYFNDVHAFFTGEGNMNYGMMWDLGWNSLKNLTYNLGISRNVMNNIVELSETLVDS